VTNTSRSTVRLARDTARLATDLLRIRHWSAVGAYEADGDLPTLSAPERAHPGTPGPVH
jgi:hypothetical protein